MAGLDRRLFLRGAGSTMAAMAMIAPLQLHAQAHDSTAFVGVDVLPMTGGATLRDQTVIVAGGRIVSLGPRSAASVPAGTRTIDGSGLTLMPGLVDMHIHLAPLPAQPGDAAQRALAVMLAHGVTTARSMAGSPNALLARAAIEADRVTGPRLYVAAPALHLQSVTTPEAARAAVRQAHGAGFDLIKSHHLTDVAVWEAVQAEARTLGLPTAGHVTNEVGLTRAVAAAQQVEHLDGVFIELMAEDAPERAIPFGQILPPPVVVAAARSAPDTLPQLAKRMAESGSWHVPTLALFEKIADVGTDTAALRALPEMRFIPEPALDQWAAERAQFLQQSGYDAAVAARFRTLRRDIVRAFHEAGVPLMAGSDTAQDFHLWGPGLIQEIETLAAAGLSNIEALRSATVVPRDYLRSLPRQGSASGWAADFGTVEAGARADLLLLDGDPSRDLGALRKVRGVMAGGDYHDRGVLDAMLDDAARAAKAQ